MYCAYCGITHDETVATSIEHVVPYSLGGSNGLTIVTCKQSNNTLGTNVDAPFMDFFPVRCTRFFLGLESTKGNKPTMDLGGTGWVDGKEVSISYAISGDSKELKIAGPNIVKTPRADGSEHWQISGDPAMVREILEGKLRKQMALGRAITLEDGRNLRPEDIDKLFAERVTVVQNPPVLKEINFNYLISVRFFSKLALAIGHLHFGETFGRSSVGETLRRSLTVQRREDVNIPGAFWPEPESVRPALQFIAEKDRHVIAIMDGKPPVLLISLFGEYGAFLPLGQLAKGQLPIISGEGTVWRIELPARKLSKLSISDLIAERSEEARRRAGEAFRL